MKSGSWCGVAWCAGSKAVSWWTCLEPKRFCRAARSRCARCRTSTTCWAPAKWLKNEGDQVKSGDVLAEIETDKATMEVEAVDEGTLGKQLIAAGTEDVLVNTPIAVILGEGEKMGDQPAPPQLPNPRPPQPLRLLRRRQRPLLLPLPPLHARKAHASSPRRSPAACEAEGHRHRRVTGLGPSWPHRAEGRGAGQARRRTCAEARGRPAIAPPPSDEQVLKLFAEGSYELVPHDGMRKVIDPAAHRVETDIPHFYVSWTSPSTSSRTPRAPQPAGAEDKDGKHVWKVSVNDFIIKAMAMALIRVPDPMSPGRRAPWVRHKHADIGVAVSIPGGSSPHRPQGRDQGLARSRTRLKDYAARARNRKLKPEEYTGARRPSPTWA